MLTIVPGVVARRQVDPRQLGWLHGRRAETRTSFPANRDYIDLRGRTLGHLEAQLALEKAAWARLAADGHSPRALDAAEGMQRRSPDVPMLDFGIASTVVALSALGCVPVMSCRGRSLGPHAHQYPAPMATFYARATHVPMLLRAAEAADVSLVNTGAKLEVYSEDLRKMHGFATALRDAIAARG